MANITLKLAADLEAEAARCSTGWASTVETIAPGCLGQCQRYGICGVVSDVVGKWIHTHNRNAVKSAVCAHRGQFECLLWKPHRRKCGKLLAKGPQYGMPTSVGALRQQCR